MHVKLHNHVQLFVIPWTAACQAPLSMGLSMARKLEWVAISSSRGSSSPGIKAAPLESSALAGGFFYIVPPGKPLI